jgi:hypothetical protein
MNKKTSVHDLQLIDSNKVRLHHTILHESLNGVFVLVEKGKSIGNGVYDAPHEEVGLNFLVLHGQ